jgi:hypothetical protein
MMKANGIKRGSRKKQLDSQQQQVAPDPPPPKPGMDLLPLEHVQRVEQQQQEQYQQQKIQHAQMHRSISEPVRRGPTQEYLDLTKKNYRLAKELVRVLG